MSHDPPAAAGGSRTRTGSVRRWTPAAWGPAGWAGAAVASAAVLGAAVAARPGLFHVDLALDPRTALALAAGLVLAAWVIRRPGTGLVVLAAFLWLNLSEVLVRFHGFPSLLQLLIVPLALAAWLERRGTGVVRALTLALTLALAGYWLVLVASTLQAWDRGLADAEGIEATKAFVLYLLVVLLASSELRLRRAVWALVASGSLLAALGVYQVATGSFGGELGGLGRIKQAQIYGDVFEPRIAGPLGDPNFFAQILLVLVPLALALVWTTERRAVRWVAFAATAVLMAGTVLTYSRGAALALGLVLALSLVAHGVRARDLTAGALLVLVALLLLPADFTRRLETLAQLLPWQEQQTLEPDSSFQERLLVTGAAWEMFLDHPLTGVGAGNYTTRFHPYGDEVGSTARFYSDPYEDHYPHNLYLEVAAETGIVGLAAFGLAVAVCLFTLEGARRRFLAHGRERTAVLARGVGIAVVGYLVSSLFLHGHFLRYLWVLFGVSGALGLLAASAGEDGPLPEEEG